MAKKTIQIACADFGPIAEPMMKALLSFVRDRYDFQVTNDLNADFVFHGGMGYDVLKYPGVRIFFTGENISPNFGITDYALAFDHMAFGDRYLWLPLIKLYGDAYQTFLKPRPDAQEVLNSKTDFCAYVMSSTRDSAEERIRIFEVLNAYKAVHSGGKWNNNVGGPVPNKLKFQQTHKFVIACENCSTPGYLTEKFAEAAQANAVPIYWGDPTIGNYFNPKAFINCHDFDSLEAMAERVKEIDQNDELYLQILSEPWFIEGQEPEELQNETIISFLSAIFDQDRETAYRRNRGRWGQKQERILRRMHERPLEHGIRRLRGKWVDGYHKIVPRKNYQG
jgi:hypothetical protein